MSATDTRKELMTVAICCYNAAHFLQRLVTEVASLESPVPFEILIVDNNSTDGTETLVKRLAQNCRVGMRYVLEPRQGIPHARNRAIEESRSSTYLAFIDADELPGKQWLKSAVKGLKEHAAECVGGRIEVDLQERPRWMSDSILLFLGKVDYGDKPFRIVDRSTPVWSGNIAYRTSIFDSGMRFDTRYNRKGSGIGGGSDGILFREMLQRQLHIRYEPEMRIRHLIPAQKMKRSYFLKLHYLAGKKAGRYEYQTDPRTATLGGTPRFLYPQLARKFLRAMSMYLTRHPEYLRESMNVSYQLGLMQGIREQGNLTE